MLGYTFPSILKSIAFPPLTLEGIAYQKYLYNYIKKMSKVPKNCYGEEPINDKS